MSYFQRLLPWGVVGLAIIYLGFAMRAPGAPPKTPDYSAAGKLPVLHGGRVKPADTLARVSLLMISNRQTWRDEDGKEHSAVEWLFDVMTCGLRGGELAEKQSTKQKKFRIEDPDALKLLGLEGRDRPDSLYAYEEFAPHVTGFAQAVDERINQLGGRQPDEQLRRLEDLDTQINAYQRFAMFETSHRVFRIDNLQLLALLGLDRRDGYRYAYYEFVPRMADLLRERDRAKDVPQKDQTEYDAAVLKLAHAVQLYYGLALLQGDTLQLIPPLQPREHWRSLTESLRDSEPSPALDGLRKILSAYAAGNALAFNKAVADYRRIVDEALPKETENTRFETFFNHFAPFYQCMLLYVGMFLLAALSWIFWERPLGRAAFALGVFTLVLQTWALWARMDLQGRPPVTNLYSSAVFVGWVCVGLGLVLEYFFPYAIASAAASILGFATALLAHHLAESGDTLEMMQAVLDTNFWLATHVVAVTIGYASTLLAGVLGVAFVLRGVLTKTLTSDMMRGLSAMIYGIVCFATLFSFTGTVLGGIWADQSWGRFWGWDPKENGALIIVIWNALILHARWAGMVKQRGMAVLSVVGIMVTMWSWIGTNQLGVGLHAYGFNNTLAMIAVGTWIGCTAVIGLGLVPLKHWQSSRV
jgi:ABC-type transport system involved in cytochrome c biogenesis permease subunit